MAKQPATTNHHIREFPLLPHENIEALYVPNTGLVADPPLNGSLLALTNKRILSFSTGRMERDVSISSLEMIAGVSIKANSNGFKDLLQGLAIMLIGVLSYFIIGYTAQNIPMATTIGIALILIGVFFVAKYFWSEEEGQVNLKVGSEWNLLLTYDKKAPLGDIYTFINRLFELQINHTAKPMTSAVAEKEQSIAPAGCDPVEPSNPIK